jgi:hypothetical protein
MIIVWKSIDTNIYAAAMLLGKSIYQDSFLCTDYILCCSLDLQSSTDLICNLSSEKDCLIPV